MIVLRSFEAFNHVRIASFAYVFGLKLTTHNTATTIEDAFIMTSWRKEYKLISILDVPSWTRSGSIGSSSQIFILPDAKSE